MPSLSHPDGIVAELSVEASLTLTPPSSGDAFDLGGAECVEAVHEYDADEDFGRLSIRDSQGDPIAERLRQRIFAAILFRT